MVISIWLPILVTLLCVLYAVFVGIYIPSWKDEGLALMIAVGSWLIYFVSTAFEDFVGRLVSGDTVSIVMILIVIITIIVYIKYRK